MNKELIENTNAAVYQLVDWLAEYGETSYDHQTFFASPRTGKLKSLYYSNPIIGIIAVSPMVFFEAFFPAGRKLFWKKQRLPISDAHYAMGFAFLSQITNREKYYKKAVHFLDILEQTRCQDYKEYCWGYPFNWETRGGTIPMGTPLITTTPYAYEAFELVYKIDKKDRWLKIMESITKHVINDIKDFKTSKNSSTCSYTPFDKGGVINASAYRAFLLTNASVLLANNEYWSIAERNLNFVLENQQPNGSWLYSIDGVRDFVDHFHTCFILKALVKIEKLTGHKGCTEAINRGIIYYLNELFDKTGRPKPFSKAPRLTVYKYELYDYAECINLGVLLKHRFRELDNRINVVLEDLFGHWQKKDASFRSRKLIFGWDNVPMHRWAQSQIFRSLCFLLHQETKNS